MFGKEKSQYIEDSKFRYTMREMKKNGSAYILALPYFLLFLIFTGIPVVISLPVGFTNFNMVQFPQWVGLSNFYTLFLQDDVFLIAIQNTLVFAIITGPVSYIACFLLAWLINEMPGPLKTVFTYIFYAPTLAGNIYATWQLIFSGDTYGFLNSVLISLGLINGPQQWLTDARYILMCVIIVQMWMSLGAGFLSLRAGFQGIDKYNDYTTLGRGGSDTTAVALAAALHADACEIYTDVDGVYTADPRKVPNARKLKEITYDEMLDLATLGAGVLHNRSVEMAKKYGVPLVVRSSLNNSEGTVVKEEVTVERMLISGVALDTDAVRIAVIGLKDSPGVAFKLFDTLAKKNINVDMILQSIGRAGTKDISFTVDKNDLDDAMGVLEANQARIAYSELHAEKNIAKLSIVGAGMMSNPGVAAKMFESLYNEGVNINMIATSEIRVTVLINEKDGVRAMNAVHDAFNLAD